MNKQEKQRSKALKKARKIKRQLQAAGAGA
jgi:hypothetical protein